MKISIAQIRPIKGNIPANINTHIKLISLAISQKATFIIFPELSLTGYEPQLAKDLAIDVNDKRLDDFQEISNSNNITIAVGAPLRSEAGILISLIIFQPNNPRQVYSKQYLHEDEFPYFIRGDQDIILQKEKKMALAICYELSIPEHSERANKNGAEVYIAAVAKSDPGAEKAIQHLSEIAKKYSMFVLMSNCLGKSGGIDCAGRSFILNQKGKIMEQLNNQDEGILILDTETGIVNTI